MDSDNFDEERKVYRRFLRPEFKASMVSSQTKNAWKRRIAQSSMQNLPVPSQNQERAQAMDVDDSNSNDDSQEDDIYPRSSSSEDSEESDESDERQLSSISSRSEQNLQDVNIINDVNEQAAYNEPIINEENNAAPEGDFNDNVNNEDINDRLNFEDDVHFNDANNEDNPPTRYPWENLILFPQSNLTVRDMLAMVRGFSLRYGLSLEGRLALVNLLKLCAGPDFDHLNLSNYLITRMFEPEEKKLTYCFYCPKCKQTLVSTNNKKMNNPEGLCDKCGSKCNLSTRKGKYILMVDLQYQIEKLFKLDVVKTALLNLHRGQNRLFAENNVIRDFQDAELYKNVNPTNSSTILTFNAFFDGAVMKRSGDENFWAALLQINELPISLRMKFIILAGLMMVDKEPQPDLMNSFIDEFMKLIDLINVRGIDLKIGDITLNFKFKILFVVLDSVARPILQFRIQYNGFFGCSWCYQRGVYTNYIRYLFDPDFQIRTHELHVRDVDIVCSRQENAVIRNDRDLRKTFVNGVKGRSSFLNLNQFFDMVWSFPLEYMHCILIGVVQHLWELWIKLSFLSQKDVGNINHLLSSLETVLENHRVMREFSSKSKWKATEWRCWLLFFGVPCLRGILPDNFLNHFALLVNTVFTLLKTEITPQELLTCEINMVQFVGEFEIFYGQNAMTFNVHILLHLVESVRRSGPLWAISAFCFESHLHILKQYALGPKKPEQQMATKAHEILDYKFQTSRDIFHSEVARQYCQKIFSPTALSRFATRSTYGVTFFGRSSRIQIINPTNNQVLEGDSFDKCIYKGTVYKSIKNTLSTKRNDTVFELRSGDVIQIHDIIRTDEKCCLSVVMFTVVPDELVKHMYKVEEKNNEISLIDITDVTEKLIYINCENASYVCRLPQNIEIQ